MKKLTPSLKKRYVQLLIS